MPDTMRRGRYTVEFDDEGATLVSSIPRARYRVNEATATKAIDFLKQHRALCFAMMNARPEELAAYRIEAESTQQQ